jgi:hypothetical protein
MVEIFGDGLFAGHDAVRVWMHGQNVAVTDFSEYGLHAAAGLCRERATPVGTMEFSAALEWAADRLAESAQAVVWLGTGYTPGYEFGGDFSRAEVIPGRRPADRRVGIAEILQVVAGDNHGERAATCEGGGR